MEWPLTIPTPAIPSPRSTFARWGGRIGAVIHGASLSGDLNEATIAAINAAVVRHKVVFFRDQHHLSDAAHEAFAARFGDPVVHPTVPVAEGGKYLSEPLRQLANTLWAVHSNDYDYAAALANVPAAVTAAAVEKHALFRKNVFTSTIYETEHPFACQAAILARMVDRRSVSRSRVLARLTAPSRCDSWLSASAVRVAARPL